MIPSRIETEPSRPTQGHSYPNTMPISPSIQPESVRRVHGMAEAGPVRELDDVYRPLRVPFIFLVYLVLLV